MTFVDDSFRCHDAAYLICRWSRQISYIKVGVAPGNCVYTSFDEHAVDPVQRFCLGTGTVDLVQIGCNADQLAGRELWPVGEDWDDQDTRVWLHTFILG